MSNGQEPKAPSCRPKSRSDHVRRLVVATVFFATAVGVVVWLVSSVILRDLSQSYVSGVLTQAQHETEGFLGAYYDSSGTDDEGRVLQDLRGSADEPMDSDLVLEGAITPVAPTVSRTERLVGPTDREVELPSAPVQRLPRPADGRVPATLSTWGHERQIFLNGELISRGALTHFHIKFPGGERLHRVLTEERRDYVLDPATDIVDRRIVQHNPNSRPITIAWESSLDGEEVELQAMIDGAVLDEGINELRAHVIPKLAWGGVLFVLLLVLAFFHVVRLIDRTRHVEAAAAEQARLAEVGTMAAGLAHEIRNPLNAVNMNLQLFEEDLQPVLQAAGGGGGVVAMLPSGSTVPSAGPLQSVRGEIDRLSSLVTDFLAYARPQEPRRAPRRMDDVVRECVELFQPMASGAGVELIADLGVGERETLVDEAMIKQALTNVIVNALDAVARPGGHVRVVTRCRPGGCEIHVLDDGPGLPDEVEPLFRVFHSTKQTGFGLGLAISRSRVEKHGGTLTGRNRPEGGAEFVISLPKDGGR